jgi:hypothetical protein
MIENIRVSFGMNKILRKPTKRMRNEEKPEGPKQKAKGRMQHSALSIKPPALGVQLLSQTFTIFTSPKEVFKLRDS